MPTLGQYVQALAQGGSGLGGWFRFESTAQATGPDANRTVVCADLADDDDGGTLYSQGYLYAIDGSCIGEQRRVSAFDGSTDGVGRFLVSAPFSTVPSAYSRWEYSAKLPRVQRGQQPGLREITNETLRDLSVADRLALESVDGLADLADSYPWLVRQDQLGAAYDPAAPGGVGLVTPTLRTDAERRYLEIGRGGYAGPVEVAVLRPANSLIKRAGTTVWTEQTDPSAGLIDDEDEALASVEDVRVVGLVRAFAALAWPNPGSHQPYWEVRYREQVQLADRLKAASAPKEAGGGRLMMTGGSGRLGASKTWGGW